MSTRQRSGGDIWVWAEHDAGALHPGVLEVLAEARTLADMLEASVSAVLLGHEVDSLTEPLGPAGAERVYLLDAPHLATFDTAAHLTALAALARSDGPPAVFLCAQTARASDLAPCLALRLGAAYLDECVWVRRAAGCLRATCAAYDDRIYQEWELPSGAPAVLTLRTGQRGAPPTVAARHAELVRRHVPDAPRSTAHRLQTIPPDPHEIALDDAERVVAAGLGIGSRERLEEVQQLADLLGAALGASRPLADRGWVPFARQIGTTGRTIAPKLYLALGISGAIQHTAGIASMETLIAVNSDRSAPLMSRATLGAVGRIEDILPRLVERLREGHEARQQLTTTEVDISASQQRGTS